MDGCVYVGLESIAMRESTAEEYLKVLKTIVESAKKAISELSDSAGAESEKDRQLIVDGMKTVPLLAIKTDEGESVPLNIGWGDPDWEKVMEILLKAPEPSREEREAALKLGKTAPYLLREAFAQTAKRLPHAPGGHPFAMQDPVQRLAVCERIEAYRISEHMDTARAVAKVADELNRKHHSVSKKHCDAITMSTSQQKNQLKGDSRGVARTIMPRYGCSITRRVPASVLDAGRSPSESSWRSSAKY